MLVAAILLAIAALLASGSLFPHRQILTYLAAAAGLWQASWLGLTLIARTLTSNSSDIVFVGGSLALLLASLVLARTRRPSFPFGRGRHDIAGELSILAVVIVALVGAWVVVRANGFVDHSYITHGFYNGDVATFTTLVQRSLLTDTLVTENPFAGNGPLEYPTLLHAGVAELINAPSASWLQLLPAMTYVTIFATIPLFFLLWESAGVAAKRRWIPLAIIALVLTASWDGYVYPQSHFFITGLLLLLVALFNRAAAEQGSLRTTLEVLGSVVGLVLLLSNAVIGTIAAAAVGVYWLWQTQQSKQRSSRFWTSSVATAAVVAIFLLFAPGEPAIGGLGFSYTAAPDMLRVTPLVILLLFGIVANLKQPYPVLLPTLLIAFSFFTFIFSGRDIVVANASRFIYGALLVAFPLMAAPLERAWSTAKSLLAARRPWLAQGAVWILVVSTLGFVLMPSAASVASTYDNLLFQDEQVVNTAMRTALWWIEDNAAPDAVFLTSPNAPFAIPALTGRSLLRTDYWLSPDDVVLADVTSAFAGDAAAQEHVLPLANYLLIAGDERALFEPLPAQHTKVFDNNAVAIYELN